MLCHGAPWSCLGGQGRTGGGPLLPCRQLYKFLLTIFVEADVNCKGTINRQEFDAIVDRAAMVPRQFGLAPPGSSKELRDKIFNRMDDNNSGTITFRKFVNWTVTHAKGKIHDHRSGMGYKK